jgi:hypothetical protein
MHPRGPGALSKVRSGAFAVLGLGSSAIRFHAHGLGSIRSFNPVANLSAVLGRHFRSMRAATGSTR